MIQDVHSGSRIRISDPDFDFLPILDYGSRGQKGTGSGSAKIILLEKKVLYSNLKPEMSKRILSD
jgi:hypothetical protein